MGRGGRGPLVEVIPVRAQLPGARALVREQAAQAALYERLDLRERLDLVKITETPDVRPSELDAIPAPGGSGTLLDNTTIVWTNELGKGNSHSLDDIPFVLVGGGLGFKTGQSLRFENVAHNRLWLSLAHAFGHHIPVFGQQDFCNG